MLVYLTTIYHNTKIINIDTSLILPLNAKLRRRYLKLFVVVESLVQLVTSSVPFYTLHSSS